MEFTALEREDRPVAASSDSFIVNRPFVSYLRQTIFRHSYVTRPRTRVSAMKRRLPPLKVLPAFEIAAQHLSFSVAAEELHLTHGAISRQVKSLETYLGVPLFRRHNRRIELTEAGRTLLPAVRTAFQMLETSTSLVTTLPRQGPLVVSCLATFMTKWLIPRLYGSGSSSPKIDVQLSTSYAPIDFSGSGIDVAIRLGKPPWPKEIAAHAFLEDRFGPVCAPGVLSEHKLEQPSDLRYHRLLHTESRTQAWSDWFASIDFRTVDITSGLRFEHTYFMLEAAVSGLGVGIGSYPLVENDLKTGRLVAPFGFVSTGRFYAMLHPKETVSVAKVKAFRVWLLNASKKTT